MAENLPGCCGWVGGTASRGSATSTSLERRWRRRPVLVGDARRKVEEEELHRFLLARQRGGYASAGKWRTYGVPGRSGHVNAGFYHAPALLGGIGRLFDGSVGRYVGRAHTI